VPRVCQGQGTWHAPSVAAPLREGDRASFNNIFKGGTRRDVTSITHATRNDECLRCLVDRAISSIVDRQLTNRFARSMAPRQLAQDLHAKSSDRSVVPGLAGVDVDDPQRYVGQISESRVP
jgi:hypothetical protein